MIIHLIIRSATIMFEKNNFKDFGWKAYTHVCYWLLATTTNNALIRLLLLSASPEAQVSAGNVRAEGRTHRATHQDHDLFLKHSSWHAASGARFFSACSPLADKWGQLICQWRQLMQQWRQLILQGCQLMQ